MEKELLLLGLLRQHEMHGYQLNALIDAHLGTSVHLAKPTAYRLLASMAERGWISFREEQEGARPSRRVYAITPEGDESFSRLLRRALASYEPAQSPSDISLAFLDVLPRPEAISLLSERRQTVSQLLEDLSGTHEHAGSFQWLMEHETGRLAFELNWLDHLIVRLDDQPQDEDTGGEA